ncbi:hypothetical protein HMPREF3137_18530 [Achromobacter xylosoxidans]|nr:hypothetical protein HMPREF3137_18530 [Achromobacter xylosoxidans]
MHWITNQPQRLNAGVAGTQIACLQQAASPECRHLLISSLMLAYMILQSGVSDLCWINDIGFRVEEIQTYRITSEGELSRQSDLDAKSIPAIEDDWSRRACCRATW